MNENMQTFRPAQLSQSDRRLRVFFDVWRLAQTAGTSTDNNGINRYIRELLRRFSAHEEIDLRYVLYPEKGFGQRHFEPMFFRKILKQDDWLGASDPIIFPVATDSVRGGEQGVWLSPLNSLPPVALTQGMPRVLVVHDVIHLKGARYWGVDRRPPIEAAVDSLRPTRDFVICDSSATQTELLRLCPISKDRSHVVHLGFDQSTFGHPNEELCAGVLRERELKRGQFILALGQTESRKNLNRLLLAYARYIHETDDSQIRLLIILSSPAHKAAVEQAASRIGLDPARIRYVEGVSDQMLASLCANAACFAYPSLEEGFGLPILEAMAAGCPVLTSDCSSMAEVAGDAAQLCDPTNADSIKRGLHSVLTDADRRRILIREGRARARAFSWDRAASDTIAVLKQVVRMSGEGDSLRRRDFWRNLTEA